MSATITNAPVEISPDREFRQSGNEINPYLFLIGTNLYQVLVAAQTETLLGVFKSTDSGATWTQMDSTHAPGDQSGTCQSIYNPHNGKIAIIYVPSALNGIHLIEFDPTSDAYGTATALLSTAVSAPLLGFVFYVKSNGDYVVLGSTSSHLWYATCTGGIWSAITNLLATGTRLYGGVVDSSDKCYFLDNESAAILNLRTIDAAFTLGSATQITDLLALGGTRPTIKFYGGDSLAVGVHELGGVIDVFIGTPLSAPVFTDYNILFPAGTELGSYPTVEIATDGTLNFFFIVIDYNVTPNVDEVRQSIFDGSAFSTPTVFYDEIANPPSNGIPIPANQFLHTFDAVQLADGSWAAATTMETGTTIFDQLCTGFFLVPEACPPEVQTPGSLPAYTAPNPPGSCIPWTPTTPRASAVFYDLPLEKQGS